MLFNDDKLNDAVITLLSGENDFELTKKLAQLKTDFDGTAERFDAADLSNGQLADIFAGQTLFAVKRLVVIDLPSTNGQLWQTLPDWTKRLSDDTELVLVEPKPDKRTSTYKWLNKNVEVISFEPLGDRDANRLTAWLNDYATEKNVRLTAQQVRHLQARGGADQWTLAQAIDKLALLDEVTDRWIDDVIEQSPHESVFALFETTLNGDTGRLGEMMNTLRQNEEPYRLFGLVTSQALQLATLVYGQGNIQKVATDTGAKSSYPLQKMAPYANRMDKKQAAQMVKLLAAADNRLKSSDADPWLVLESTLAQVASLR